MAVAVVVAAMIPMAAVASMGEAMSRVAAVVVVVVAFSVEGMGLTGVLPVVSE